MKARFILAVAAAVAVPLLFAACTNENKQAQSDGAVFVELNIGDESNCIYWNVNPAVSPYQRPNIALLEFNSIIKKPASDARFLDVQMTDMWVTWQRIDGGTKIPRPFHFVYGILLPAAGDLELSNAPIMSLDQMLESPFDDLINYGYDRETGNLVIRLRGIIDYYGKTYSGDAVKATTEVHAEFANGVGCVND